MGIRPRHMRVAVAILAFLVMLAVAGALAAGSGWSDWYEALDRPGWLAPLWVFYLVAPLYYAMGGFLLYRLLTRADEPPTVCYALLVLIVLMLVANEAWNVVFLARQSVAGGFFGLIPFAAIVVALWIGLWRSRRRLEAFVLLPYVIWVGYDVAWAFALWRMN